MADLKIYLLSRELKASSIPYSKYYSKYYSKFYLNHSFQYSMAKNFMLNQSQ
jgi:hypothetical protein